MQRYYFFNKNVRLSYLDTGGEGDVLLALHAHWMEATTFKPLAAALAPTWRVIALDQRGHGYSDHSSYHSREIYAQDILALLQHLSLAKSVVLLGNSFGGIVAYQFAAQYPALVRGMIIEDIGVELADDTRFCLAWSGTFETREALEERIGQRLLPYLQDSFRKTPAGWKLAFDPAETELSTNTLNGNHWHDWLASSCPTLLIRGSESPLSRLIHFEEMENRRPNTQLRELKGGHVVHFDNIKDCSNAVKLFLNQLEPAKPIQ